MTNALFRLGTTYSTPAIPYRPARPAYTYTVSRVATRVGPPTTVKVGRWITIFGPPAVGGGSQPSQTQVVWDPNYSVSQPTNEVYTITEVVSVPADPGSPGVAGTRVDKPPLGWTSFAHSKTSIVGTGYATWEAPPKAVGVAIGMATDTAPKVGYGHLTHGLLLSGGTIRNLRTGSSYGTYTTGDTFKMQVTRSSVIYSLNGTPIGTEPSTYPPAPLFLSSVLYGVGDSVDVPVLVGQAYGSAITALAPLDGFSGQGSRAQSRGALAPLYGISGVMSRSAGVLAPLEGYSGTGVRGQSLGVLAPLEGAAYGGTLVVIPNNYSETELAPLEGAAVMFTGGLISSAAALEPLFGMSSDHNYAYSQGQLAPLEGYAFDEPQDQAFMFEVMRANADASATLIEVALMVSGAVFATTMLTQNMLTALMQSGMVAQTSMSTMSIMQAIMNTLVLVGDISLVPDGNEETWAVNVETQGSTNYSAYGFNSYARIGERYYGAKPGGIYGLDGDTDDGEDIAASISLGLMDFGSHQKKTIEQCYLGMSSCGNLFLRVVADGQAFLYKTMRTGHNLQQQRVTPGKGMRSNYFELEIYNEKGEDFELESVQFLVVDIKRKI